MKLYLQLPLAALLCISLSSCNLNNLGGTTNSSGNYNQSNTVTTGGVTYFMHVTASNCENISQNGNCQVQLSYSVSPATVTNIYLPTLNAPFTLTNTNCQAPAVATQNCYLTIKYSSGGGSQQINFGFNPPTMLNAMESVPLTISGS